MNSSPSDQHTPGSLLSWPLMDFNTPLSCLLQEELQHPSSFMGSNRASPPPLQLLSSQASMGASTAKVSKRKSRAVTKPPIRVLSADRESFRDMVQKLTGIPTSPSMQGSRLGWGASHPQSIFHPRNDLMAHQSMPTLDTSSAYLPRGFCNNILVHNEMGNKARFNTNYAENFDPSMQKAVNFGPNGGVGGAMFEGGAYNEGGMGMDMESLELPQWRRRKSDMESLLMGSSKLEDAFQSNKMDPWLSSDLIHAPSPTMEIAHSA